MKIYEKDSFIILKIRKDVDTSCWNQEFVKDIITCGGKFKLKHPYRKGEINIHIKCPYNNYRGSMVDVSYFDIYKLSEFYLPDELFEV